LNIFYLSIVKYSANGPKASAGKYERALSTTIIAKVIKLKVSVSVFSVPADSGTYFLAPNKPAMAIGPI